ncbi:DUF4184 family protein [Paenibacillus gansuensis]|uniref:DUF4184 family protein n=1 Tax=Paenibacillus gansuensis TaxID=306542 RepID=A0ABW5PCT6_9BACL
MPFTFAHPLYALPLKFINPRHISAWGLVLGSMSPDFEYFLALEPYQTIGHTHQGLWLQAIPLSVLFVLVFSFVLRILAMHVPSVFQLDRKLYASLEPFEYRKVSSWILFLITVVIGFYSHVFIDSFTHVSGSFARQERALQQEIFQLPLYKWLQYSLSLLGLVAELLLVLWLVRNSVPAQLPVTVQKRRKIHYWLVVIITAAVVVSLKLAFTESTNIVGILVVSSISGTIVGIVLASCLFNKYQQLRRLG